MHEEFVPHARIEGLSEWRIVIHHGARNALMSVARYSRWASGRRGGNVVIRDGVQRAGHRRLWLQGRLRPRHPGRRALS